MRRLYCGSSGRSRRGWSLSRWSGGFGTEAHSKLTSLSRATLDFRTVPWLFVVIQSTPYLLSKASSQTLPFPSVIYHHVLSFGSYHSKSPSQWPQVLSHLRNLRRNSNHCQTFHLKDHILLYYLNPARSTANHEHLSPTMISPRPCLEVKNTSWAR